jgi:hypothetical protein
MRVSEGFEIAADNKRMQNSLVQYLEILHWLSSFALGDAVSERGFLTNTRVRWIDGEFQTVGTVWLADESCLCCLSTPLKARDEEKAEGKRQETGDRRQETGATTRNMKAIVHSVSLLSIVHFPVYPFALFPLHCQFISKNQYLLEVGRSPGTLLFCGRSFIPKGTWVAGKRPHTGGEVGAAQWGEGQE